MATLTHPKLVYADRRTRRGDVTVTLRGDLDIAAAPGLRERLRGALEAMTAPHALTIDLSQVTFCDAAGLAVLVGAYRRAQSLGITVTIAGARPRVTKVLHATGLDRAFEMSGSLTTPQKPMAVQK
jgi:anti-sigma B factor antagonist